jgi:hypothetical protein
MSHRSVSMAKELDHEKRNKPAYDEETLSNLLEAAFVLQEHHLQEHNRAQREPVVAQPPAAELELSLPPLPPVAAADEIANTKVTTSEPSKDDYTPTLAQIVETQHQIQLRHLELNEALSLVAERITEIAHAGGAAVGIVDEKNISYRAVAGAMTPPLGAEVVIEKALSAASIKTGHVIHCQHVNSEFLIDPEECRRRRIRSLISVPVYHEGGIAGALELYYSKAEGASEQDVHSCQLMAGLITEALARADEMRWKKSLADERAVMAQALEKLKPNLAALLDASSAQKSSDQKSAAKAISSTGGETGAHSAFHSMARSDSGAAAAMASSVSSGVTHKTLVTCPKCGNQIVGEEQFCGKCGLPRSSDYEPPSMQSKVASLWQMQEASRKKADASDAETSTNADADSDLASTALMVQQNADAAIAVEKHAASNSAVNSNQPKSNQEEKSSVADWSSAASARDFLERLATRPGGLNSLWQSRRGDVYLVIAVVILAICALWGAISNRSVGASGNPAATAARRKPAPDSDLSTFDRILISMGLAEAPQPPESKGNPDTEVWVDLQTGLYYCPGADLYSKTPKGKLESQRDAQLDQFESASRKACN